MHRKSFTAVVTALFLLVIVAAQPIEAATYAITIQIDASSYSGAQTLTASGAVSPPPGSGTAVLLRILNPSGTPVATGSASVNGSTGSYQRSFVLGGSSSWVAGTYVVNASWGNSVTGPVIFKTAIFVYSPSVSTTTSTTTSSTSTTSITSNSTTSTTSSQTSTSTSSSTTTTSATSTTPSTSSSSTTSTQTTTSSTTQTGSGGIPEFPFQILTVTFFTFVLVASYLLARRNAMPGGRLRRP